LNEIERIGKWQLETRRDTIRLDITDCWIDAFDGPDRPDPLLDGLDGVSISFDHWLVTERAWFENHWQKVLEEQLNDLIAKGAAPADRSAVARNLLNFIPSHDPAVRALMTAFAEMGDRALAIREYERFRMAVKNSHGARPSETTVALYEAIRRGPRARNAWQSNKTAQINNEDSILREQERDLDAVGSTVLARRLQPSIAVLPFQNLSGEPGHDHVAEGLVDDLIESLSHVPQLFVISRLSASLFRDQDGSPREIGAALGVRYLLNGSVRIIRNRLRLIVELTDADTGTAFGVWSFDEKVSGLLALQDRLAETVVRSISPDLRSAELRRMRLKRPEDHDAYDLLLRGQENMHSPSRAVFDSSEGLFKSAIALDPNYATAHAWLAYWHVMRVGQGWSPDRTLDTKEADRFAQKAFECDHRESMAFAVQGHVAAYLHRDFDLAFACFETALQINPNSARAWLWSASAHGWMGNGAQAVEKISRAEALSPFDPLICAYSGSASLAYLADHQYARSIEFGPRCIRENRAYSAAYKTFIPAMVLSGRELEARTQVHRLLALEPGFTVQQFRRRFPGGDRPIGELCCDALTKAGVPLSN
jgi:TolB-like protein